MKESKKETADVNEVMKQVVDTLVSDLVDIKKEIADVKDVTKAILDTKGSDLLDKNKRENEIEKLMAEMKEVCFDIAGGVRYNNSNVKVGCQEVTQAVIQRIDMSTKACIEAARDQHKDLASLLGTMTKNLVTLDDTLCKIRRQAEEAQNAHVHVMELMGLSAA